MAMAAIISTSSQEKEPVLTQPNNCMSVRRMTNVRFTKSGSNAIDARQVARVRASEQISATKNGRPKCFARCHTRNNRLSVSEELHCDPTPGAAGSYVCDAE